MTPSAIALWRWIYSQRIYVNNKVHLRTEPQGETKESHNYSYNKQAHSMPIILLLEFLFDTRAAGWAACGSLLFHLWYAKTTCGGSGGMAESFRHIPKIPEILKIPDTTTPYFWRKSRNKRRDPIEVTKWLGNSKYQITKSARCDSDVPLSTRQEPVMNP